jgi:hypothetical protein
MLDKEDKNINYTAHDFFNFGYVKTKLPKKLYNSLLKECLNAEKNREMISGLSSTGVPKHFYIEKNYEELVKFIIDLQNTYEETYPGASDVKVLTENVPYAYQRPWINIHKQNEFVPCHQHDGVFSYSIWMKIPYDSTKEKYSGNFDFLYTDVLGRTRMEHIKLSKKDEGTIIIFPSKLHHVVWPFYNNEKIRISVSGNVMLKAK